MRYLAKVELYWYINSKRYKMAYLIYFSCNKPHENPITAKNPLSKIAMLSPFRHNFQRQV